MEFENIYNDAFKKKHVETEKFIKDFLTDDENSIYDFNTNHNELIKIREEIYKDSKFNISDIYIDLLKNFNEFTSKIQEKPIENTLKLKILPLYNTYLDKGLISITFEQLIVELANYKSENNAFRIFRNQYHLFEKIYESKDYSKYEIKEYGMILESTDIYKYYFKIKQSNKKTTSKYNSEIINNSNILEKYSKIDDFEIEEKYLLLHAFYRMIESKTFDSSKFELTEFLRMIIICQNIEDKTIFEKNYTKKFYKSVKDGLDYFANVNNKTKIKKRLSTKLTDLNLNKLADEVKGLKI